MSGIEIELDWYKDAAGYELKNYGKHGAKISRKGGPLVPTHPLRNDRVFTAFANVTSAEGLLNFVNNYGLLNDYESSAIAASVRFADGAFTENLDYPEKMAGEDVDEHLSSARQFREFLKWTGRRGRARSDLSEWIEDELLNSSLANVRFTFDPRKGFQIVLAADTLMHGLLLQLANSVTGGKYNACRMCGQVFEVGPRAGRRTDAKFCSDEHRMVYNSRARTKVTG
jgi:hypothetical protein